MLRVRTFSTFYINVRVRRGEKKNIIEGAQCRGKDWGKGRTSFEGAQTVQCRPNSHEGFNMLIQLGYQSGDVPT